MRSIRLAACAVAAGALAAPLVMSGTASATGGTGSAYGLAATGLVAIPATPAVAATADRSLLHLPANPLIDVKVLHVTAKPAYARASVTDLSVAKAALRAHLVTATCTAGTATSHLVNATLAGRRLAADAAPNSALTIPVQGLGTASVTLNKQVRNADGTLTVTAIEAVLPLGPGHTQTLSVSSATCAGIRKEPPGQAPKPEPVPSDLPVTG
ncbi:choice-of-anchor P family protein [Actinoallomurus sp. NPDC052308]|uniref:choice-of-anchor P family protein n=1 Tax=Actinoallomurus sp. NPDC052308 TaxID=3155530 RepID=UPI003423E2DD